MKTFVVYGASGMTAPELTQRLSTVLGVDFEERTSDYWGDYYKAGKSPAENLRVLRNEAAFEGDLPYEDFEDFPLILEVNCATAATLAAIEGGIDGLVVLERTEV